MERDDYTWEMVARDLASRSRLTMVEAVAVCDQLHDLVHPCDALTSLICIVNGAQNQGGLFGARLARLLRAARTS